MRASFVLHVSAQASLMRLGLRFIRENRCEGQWIGPLPSDEDIDEWETTKLRGMAQVVEIRREMRRDNG